MGNWQYEADLGIDHEGFRQAIGNIGPYADEAELVAAVQAAFGSTLGDLRRDHPRFGEYPDGTEGIPETAEILGGTLTRYSDNGTDDEWSLDINP
ncbi:hypothetical protein PXH69_28950 [Rhodococcus qingshengii]|uniref:Uncharacterized protein n=1 Tax=Rhodococcus qingshengii TaxID=334542 RepID=A0AAW6LMX5_RHOSG|nr:hypothetical protein [Rhodococcus qingshengii]MDE8649007.1 hypothetical protein [Rhodococcus qingshengii]